MDKTHIVIAVWGTEYINLFLNVSLPSQLADGNIPSFSRSDNVVYKIYTIKGDEESICRHPAFKKLASLIKTEVIAVDNIQTEDKFSPLMYFHNRSIEEADNARAALIFLSPDFVMAKDTLSALMKRMREGYRAVMILTLRLNREAAAADLLRKFYEEGEAVLSASPRELVRVALKHLHPIEKTYYWRKGFSRFPIHAYWPVNDEGLIARCFYLHPIMVNPLIRGVKPQITIDADYVDLSCPDLLDIYVSRDSDEIACFELTDPNAKDLNAESSSTTVSSAWDYARWAVVHANPLYTSIMHHWLFQIPINIHATDLSSDWKKIGLMSANVAACVRWATTLLRKHGSISKAFDFILSLRNNKMRLNKLRKKKYHKRDIDIQTLKKIDTEGLDIELYAYPLQLFSEKYSLLVDEWLGGSMAVRKEDVDRSYTHFFVVANVVPAEFAKIDLSGKFFGTSWGHVERNIHEQKWRWLGPDGTSNLYLSLLPNNDYFLETLVQDELNNSLSLMTVLVNEQPAVEQRIINKKGRIWHSCIFRTSNIYRSTNTKITYKIKKFTNGQQIAMNKVICRKIGWRTLI